MTTRDLSQQECDTLILSLAAARGDAGFTQEDAEAVVNWARQVRFDAGLLEAILAGDMLVNVVDGKVAVRLTPNGEERARRLVAEAKGRDTEVKNA